MEGHIYPAEPILAAHAADPKTKWTLHPKMEELKVMLVLLPVNSLCRESFWVNSR